MCFSVFEKDISSILLVCKWRDLQEAFNTASVKHRQGSFGAWKSKFSAEGQPYNWAQEQSRQAHLEAYMNGSLHKSPKDHSVAQALYCPQMHLQETEWWWSKQEAPPAAGGAVHYTLHVHGGPKRCVSTSPPSHCRQMLKWFSLVFNPQTCM